MPTSTVIASPYSATSWRARSSKPDPQHHAQRGARSMANAEGRAGWQCSLQPLNQVACKSVTVPCRPRDLLNIEPVRVWN